MMLVLKGQKRLRGMIETLDVLELPIECRETLDRAFTLQCNQKRVVRVEQALGGRDHARS